MSETLQKQNYKQTEVGLIPKEWYTEKFDNLTQINGLVRGPFGGALKKDSFVRDGYKVYEQKNAIYNSVEIGSYYINDSKFFELKRFEVKEGDFILSCSGTIGSIYRIPKKFKKGIINQALLIIRINEDKVDPEYFYHQFVSDLVQGNVIDDTQGGAMKNLVGMSEFRKALIPFPPTLTEQRAIATALSDVDELLTSLEQLISKKQAIKQGAMQELLTPPHKGGKRLPGFSGEWEEKKLGECLNYEQPTKYLVSDSDYEGQTQTPVLTAGKSFILGYTDEENGIYQNLPVIIFDDFTTSNHIVNFKFKVKSSAMKMLRPVSKEYDLYFIHSIMNLINFSLGDDHKRRWITEYSDIVFFIPKIREQKAIAQVLSDMDEEIKALEEKKDKYQKIKEGMMQDLLTGKIRLV